MILIQTKKMELKNKKMNKEKFNFLGQKFIYLLKRVLTNLWIVFNPKQRLLTKIKIKW